MDNPEAELKERFLQDLTRAERLSFLRDAREAMAGKRYRAGEDLFWFCYYRALRRRLSEAGFYGGEGYVRILLAEGKKEIEDVIKMYEARLERGKTTAVSQSAEKFLEYFSG